MTAAKSSFAVVRAPHDAAEIQTPRLTATTILQLLDVTDENRVSFPGTVVPETCVVRLYLQVECPGCGLTRSIIRPIHGRIIDSIKTNAGGLVIVLCTAAFLIMVWKLKSAQAGNIFTRMLPAGSLIFTVTILLNWIWCVP